MKMFLLNILLQAEYKTEINKILTNYAIPTVGLMMLLGVITGVVKNWELISDNSGSGRRKEGFINTLFIVGYTALGIAVLSIAVALIANIKLKV